MKKILIVGIPLVVFNAIVMGAIFTSLEPEIVIPIWAEAIIAIVEFIAAFLGIFFLGRNQTAEEDERWLMQSLESAFKGEEYYVHVAAGREKSDAFYEYCNHSLSNIVANTAPRKNPCAAPKFHYIGGLNGIFLPKQTISEKRFCDYENSEVIARSGKKKIRILDIALSVCAVYLVALGILLFMFIKGGVAAVGLLPIAIGVGCAIVCAQLKYALKQRW